MASRIPEVKECYNALLDGVEIELGGSTYGFADTRELPYPTRFPASTLMLSETTQDDVETGGHTDNQWVFIHTVYVDFSGENAEAIEELELFIEAVQSAVRHASPDDLTLPSGYIQRLDIDGSIRPGDGELPNARVAFKEFLITATTVEI